MNYTTLASTAVMGRERSFRSGSFVVYIFALAVVALVSVASYPGFMSFDSVEALRQAREGVQGSQYPPFGSYVWRIFDWIWPGPTLMQIFQNGTLLLSFGWILNNIGWPIFVRLIVLALFSALPALLGTMLVVWKDVAVAAFYMLSLALAFEISSSSRRKKWLTAAAVFFLFCGMAYRFNAASGALPIMIYIFFVNRGGASAKEGLLIISAKAFAALLLLFSLVWVVNSFRFPEFTRLEKNTNMASIMRYDLVGISVYSGVSFVDDKSGNPVDPKYLEKIYDARHLNITSHNDSEGRIADEVDNLFGRWIAAISKNPVAYLKHRFAVFSEYIGLHNREIFYVTHPNVDENKLGVSQTPNRLTPVLVNYVVSFKQSLLDRAWIYYLAGMLALLSAFVRGPAMRYRVEAAVALGSALLYLAPMYFITPAGDLRYNFWSISGALVCLVFVFAGHFAYRRDKNVSSPSSAN
ncbi:hypothetical protein QTI51_28820 [Variovorax sp. J22G73]|uniref:hypothetical protein n=1 Tax=unclassified Variovorax TaxID=663243 RepID=UPI0025775774|nr:MULTISPECIES: hypothetical protein [unclassified Variovorax]MDM0008850.1 hypothetical protein [Variovorax sp. J22R203]MDM0101314.1 hypothetical protein [Variovorax sp. J22G73]